MRLIDADELKKNFQDELCKGIACAECSIQVEGFCRVERWIDIAPTIEAVPFEDYRSMEQTVHKLTQALAEVEPRWIPTTERLPDVGVYVLVCTKQKSGQIIERIGVYSGTSYGWSTGGATREVVAWMPLPKAYKGDEVEE